MAGESERECRSLAAEIRAEGRRLVGHAAVFGQPTKIGTFTETVRAGAFAASLAAAHDVLGLVDHDPSRVLGRTKSGTLKLSEDERGLAFSIDLPETQAARDILALALRGDIGGASFRFSVPKGGDHWEGDRRELRSVVLHEISIVQAWPAYPNTDVSARARQPLSFAARYRRIIAGQPA